MLRLIGPTTVNNITQSAELSKIVLRFCIIFLSTEYFGKKRKTNWLNSFKVNKPHLVCFEKKLIYGKKYLNAQLMHLFQD